MLVLVKWRRRKYLYLGIFLCFLGYLSTRDIKVVSYSYQPEAEERLQLRSVAVDSALVRNHTSAAALSLDQSWMQTDEALINYIKHEVLLPPDDRPYNVSDQTRYDWKTSQFGLENVIIQLFNNKTGGVFVEAGAFDGEYLSNTLYLEKIYNWTGLLVEGDPDSVKRLKATHRKAWLAPVLLSITTSPAKLTIKKFQEMSSVQLAGNAFILYRCNSTSYTKMTHENAELLRSSPECVPVGNREVVDSIPLYSLLEAASFTDIDFFSLDVEGVELDVLKTIPFELINIKVLLVEKNHHSDPSELLRIMERYNYQQLQMFKGIDITKKLPVDFMFIKRDFLSTLL